MRLKISLIGMVAALLCAGAANAATLRVIVVETSDAAGYVKALEQGKALLKAKGSSAVLRVWKGTFAGESTGAVVVSIEYADLAALAKDAAAFRSDADLRAWLQGLDKYRKIVSDSIYEELKP